MKEILIPLNFSTTPTLYDTQQSFSTSDVASGVLIFTTTADVSGSVASLTIRNASENANRQTVLVDLLDVNSSPFSYAVKMPLPFGSYEGEVLLKKNLTVLASATFLFGVNSSLSAEVLPKLVEAYSLDELVESVETEVSVLKDAYSLTVSETVKGVNKTESTLQLSENVRYLNEATRKANELLRISQENARVVAEEGRVTTFGNLVDSSVIEQTVTQEVAEKYIEIESTQANRLLSAEQQLADISINARFPFGTGLAPVTGNGTDDDVINLQKIVDYAKSNNLKVYLPAHTYYFKQTLFLPMDFILFGAGDRLTKIFSTASGFAIEMLGGGTSHQSQVFDLYIYGDATGSVGSTGGGGLFVNGANDAKISRVSCDGFASGGWLSTGSPLTELKPGLKIAGTVGVVLEDCYTEHNDIGFLVEKGQASVNTSTIFRNCSSRINRTHAVKWLNTMSTIWSEGIIESNNGLVTFLIKNEGGSNSTGNKITGGAHFENNNRVSPYAIGSCDIKIEDSTLSSDFALLDCSVGIGAKCAIDLQGTSCAKISNSSLTATPSTLIINSDCKNTFINDTFIARGITNNGVGTKINGQITAQGVITLNATTPDVAGIKMAILPPITVTNFTGGTKGQILELKTRAGTVLGIGGNTNFSLMNGSDTMSFGEGSRIVLQLDEITNKWTLIYHQPNNIFKKINNASTVYIDDGSKYFVDDTNTTAISTIYNGYDGQVITILSKNSGVSTTISVLGNIKLASATNFVMTADDTLTILYNKSANKWYEISRCIN